MNATLPPEAWRSEAFAEDLADETPDAPAAGHRGALLGVLLGALPVVLAAAGAVAAVWSSA